MKTTALLLVLTVMLSGCGDPNSQPVVEDKARKLCAAVLNNGLSTLCIPSDEHHKIGIMFDSNDGEMARRLCMEVASKLKPMMADFSGQWKLEVYSPLRIDKPLNYCVLR